MTDDPEEAGLTTQEVPAVGRGDTDVTRSQSGARLVELVGSRTGRVHRIECNEAIIGRDPSAQVLVESGDISRRHARIYCDQGEWAVEDLGSRNGICVNGRPVAQSRLSFGDHLQLGGSALFVFTYYDQLEEQILQVQRMESMGSLAGGVAHDFNNLLSVLVGNIDFLEQRRQVDDVDPKLLGECLGEMRDAAGHAENLIRQLLRFSRPSRGGANAMVDCSRLLLDAIGLCRRTFGPKISFVVQADDELQVQGDAGQLNQVLMNLLINGRDAMPNGGTLTVRATALAFDHDAASAPYLTAGRYVRVEIEDSGVGMDEPTRSRVFEPFFTTKEPDQGTGLGLSTVYALVRKHGGHVQVRSDLGQGTAFTVYLPAAGAAGDEQTTTRPVEDIAGAEAELFGMPKVLLVDDEPAVLRTTSRLLRQIGYEVLVAANGSEALELYRDNSAEIELVLLDVLMPGLDGGGTLAKLREHDPGVRVLLISGRADERRIAKLLEAGAQGFLSKPCGASSLQQAIAAALN
jgi:two-component system cell cycle sensor histidine kinase/response regulator CckA